MVITTTNTFEGKNIKEYRGVVFGEVVNGISYYSDFRGGITNVMGGRSAEYEQEIINTRADAIREMMKRAEQIGANAIVGVKIDYETISNMILVVASGSAVVIE